MILDNCSDNSENIFIGEDFIQVFNIKNQETVGKDQAVSILIEKLSSSQNFNAYVFLDANRYVEEDFLYQINSALIDSPVISGSTVLLSENKGLKNKIISTYHKYITNFIQKSRALMGLATLVDSNVFVIRQDIMEKIGCVDFQNINTELKYSLLLSRVGYKCVFTPNIKTYMNTEDYNLRIPSLKARLNLFANAFPQIWTPNFTFNEHVLSLIYPNVWLVILLYVYFLKHSFKYYFIVDFTVVLLTFGALILGLTLSLLGAKISAKETPYLLLYPFYSLGNIIKNLPISKGIRKTFKRSNIDDQDEEKHTINVMVSDGRNNIPCKLDLISENGLAKVNFRFKRKKFNTSTHLRMVDAIKELTDKLEEYGFILKICQCCKFFSHNIDGSTNMIKGFCGYKFSNALEDNKLPTLLWNSCRAFMHEKPHNVIEEIAQ